MKTLLVLLTLCIAAPAQAWWCPNHSIGNCSSNVQCVGNCAPIEKGEPAKRDGKCYRWSASCPPGASGRNAGWCVPVPCPEEKK